MADAGKFVRGIRFECRDAGLVLCLTFETAREVVVEEVPFGSVDPREIQSSLTDAMNKLEACRHTEAPAPLAEETDPLPQWPSPFSHDDAA